MQHIDEFWRIKVDGNAWSKVLHLGVRKEFKRGESIIHAGELITKLHYIHSGAVCMKRTSLDGGEKIIMYVERNSLFSEVPFFTCEEICSNFISHQDAVIYTFDKPTVDRMLDEYPDIAKDIIQTLSQKVSVLSNQLVSLGLDTLEQRIVKFILLQYNSTPLSTSEVVSFGSLRMKDIASILGVHRVTLYKAFKVLEKMGLVQILGENRLQIIDMDGLSSIAYQANGSQGETYDHHSIGN